MRRDHHNYGGVTTANDEDDDDDESPPSSRSSFASQIHRPLAHLRAGILAGANTGPSGERVVSMGSCSDVSNLCDIEDSEYETEDIRPTTTTNSAIHKPGQSIQTDV